MVTTRLTRIKAALAAPGAHGPISNAAPTISQWDVFVAEDSDGGTDTSDTALHVTKPPKIRRLDRWLDVVVAASGSQPVFVIIVLAIAVWALMGIKYGQDENWQVLISDVQAILCYAYDSFLMRQQLNSHDRKIRTAAALRSRMVSVKRMLRQLNLTSTRDGQAQPVLLWSETYETHLPRGSITTRISTWACRIFGHIVTCGLYWVCIVIWLAFGPYCQWSDRWQLYINSATSALMVLIFAFLANIRQIHEKHAEKCFRRIDEVDTKLEKDLRLATGDSIPNPEIRVQPPPVNRLQRAIFYYADVIGTLVGVVLLIGVMVAWISIGPALHFNSNWWLIIGTYAGLIGMQDGVVLHNVQSEFNDREDRAFETVRYEDEDAFSIVSASVPAQSASNKRRSFSARFSVGIGRLWAHPYIVVACLLLIIGLIIGASALRWSLTGQLLCNVPPSIIESYIMMALLTGHTISEKKERQELDDLYRRRQVLTEVVARTTKGAKLDAEVTCDKVR